MHERHSVKSRINLHPKQGKQTLNSVFDYYGTTYWEGGFYVTLQTREEENNVDEYVFNIEPLIYQWCEK